MERSAGVRYPSKETRDILSDSEKAKYNLDCFKICGLGGGLVAFIFFLNRLLFIITSAHSIYQKDQGLLDCTAKF